MANPKILRGSFNVESDSLEIVVARDRTDALNGNTVEEGTVRGKLSDLTGVGAFRNNVVAWVKARTGFGGTVDVAPPAP